MIGSLVLFVICIIIYITICDIVTILFRLTGLTEEKARFQAVSLLTNSGFTTQESEVIVASKRRRNMARATMLFGYAFTVTIVSTLVNFFTTLGDAQIGQVLLWLPLLLLALAVFYLVRRTPYFKARFDAVIEKLGTWMLFGKDANRMILVETYGEMVVAHIYLHTVPEALKDTPLSQSGIREKYNVMVMMVKTPEQEAQQAGADTILRAGDVIMVLGKQSAIHEVFENRSDEAKDPA